jgi:UDP-N-acetylmuramoyl-L-alanyl-D-glutamate--2,6-diaminopimelate ligase
MFLIGETKMLLNTLLEESGLTISMFENDLSIHEISTNSSSVKEKDLFVAIPGHEVDGHDFIWDAIQSGAVAVVGENDSTDLPVPYIKVSNSRLAAAKLACAFYGHPSKNKTVIGITGTNGKTTTAYMIKHILESTGKKCTLFGTVMNSVNGRKIPSENTTLDALTLQKHLYLSNDDFVIMEVSSHGLSQYRVEGVEFDYCLFTNLDHDHLDYHENMEAYFAVKESLFYQLKSDGTAVINSISSWGETLEERLRCMGVNLAVFGNQQSHDLKMVQSPVTFKCDLIEKKTGYELNLPMPGEHNRHNAALAYLLTRKMGLSPETILNALNSFQGVPGRFDIMHHPNGAKIVIDYAHTADAFYHCLKTAREEGAKKIYHIFGFRGGRDMDKRQAMVTVSQEFCDHCILTLDDLNQICQEKMEEELFELAYGKCVVIPDRTLAIKMAWNQANEGDWIFITGKGPEKYQQSFKLPSLSDKETIEYLGQK